MSEATNDSWSPMPTTIGGPLRTATIFSGSSDDISTSANRPRTRASIFCVATSSEPAPFFSSRATMCATISVSVSDWNLWPSAISSCFSSR